MACLGLDTRPSRLYASLRLGTCALLSGVGVLSGQLYATGGHDGPLVRKSVEVYDPGTNTWKQVADMNMCRRNAGSIPALSFLPLGVSGLFSWKVDSGSE